MQPCSHAAMQPCSQAAMQPGSQAARQPGSHAAMECSVAAHHRGGAVTLGAASSCAAELRGASASRSLAPACARQAQRSGSSVAAARAGAPSSPRAHVQSLRADARHWRARAPLAIARMPVPPRTCALAPRLPPHALSRRRSVLLAPRRCAPVAPPRIAAPALGMPALPPGRCWHA